MLTQAVKPDVSVGVAVSDKLAETDGVNETDDVGVGETDGVNEADSETDGVNEADRDGVEVEQSGLICCSPGANPGIPLCSVLPIW